MSESHFGGSRRHRLAADPGVKVAIQARDREIAMEIFLMRALTRRHLQAFGLLPPSVTASNARLRKLFDARYLRRAFVTRGAYATEAVYVIGPEAVSDVVAETGMSRAEVARLSGHGLPSFLDHCLLVADVRQICLRSAPAKRWISEVECRHEFSIRASGGTEHTTFKPDGALAGTVPVLSVCFFEVDRGCVSAPQFERSCVTYRRYFAGAALEENYGTRSAVAACVTIGGDRRISHLVAASGSAGFPMRFASLADFRAHGPFAEIWHVYGSTRRTFLEVPS